MASRPTTTRSVSALRPLRALCLSASATLAVLVFSYQSAFALPAVEHGHSAEYL